MALARLEPTDQPRKADEQKNIPETQLSFCSSYLDSTPKPCYDLTQARLEPAVQPKRANVQKNVSDTKLNFRRSYLESIRKPFYDLRRLWRGPHKNQETKLSMLCVDFEPSSRPFYDLRRLWQGSLTWTMSASTALITIKGSAYKQDLLNLYSGQVRAAERQIQENSHQAFHYFKHLSLTIEQGQYHSEAQAHSLDKLRQLLIENGWAEEKELAEPHPNRLFIRIPTKESLKKAFKAAVTPWVNQPSALCTYLVFDTNALNRIPTAEFEKIQSSLQAVTSSYLRNHQFPLDNERQDELLVEKLAIFNELNATLQAPGQSAQKRILNYLSVYARALDKEIMQRHRSNTFLDFSADLFSVLTVLPALLRMAHSHYCYGSARFWQPASQRVQNYIEEQCFSLKKMSG